MEKNFDHQLSLKKKKKVNLRSEEKGELKDEPKCLKNRQCSSGSDSDYKARNER